MTIWFTADTHFNHANIIKHCNRPFKTVAEMDTCLINNWNKVVKAEDTVYHLGDFAWGNTNITEWYSKLNGRVLLIRGNHDKRLGCMFGVEDRSYAELEYKGKTFILSHYPFEVWNKKHYGSIHLHGHCHGTLPKIENRFDVGVDCNNYKPVNIESFL